MNATTVGLEDPSPLQSDGNGTDRTSAGQGDAAELVRFLGACADRLCALDTAIFAYLDNPPTFSSWNYGKAAWLLDRYERTEKEVNNIQSRGTELLSRIGPEGTWLRDAVLLVRRELETQKHHADRAAEQLRNRIGSATVTKEVAPLTYEGAILAHNGSGPT